jgi:hypothetical protein
MNTMNRRTTLTMTTLAFLCLGIALAFGLPLMAADDKPSDVNNPFVGKWTYRSFINDPDPVDVDPPEKKAEKIAKLLLFEAELVLEAAPSGEIQGKLNTGAYGTLTVFGSGGYGSPFSIRIQAVGKDKGSPSEGWIYDYIGWLIPAWPNGVDQRPSIVGSVIRTVPHSNGQFKAGEVASFIAVKKD